MLVDYAEADEADLDPVEVDWPAAVTVTDAPPRDLTRLASSINADERVVEATKDRAAVSVAEERELDALETVRRHICFAVI